MRALGLEIEILDGGLEPSLDSGELNAASVIA